MQDLPGGDLGVQPAPTKVTHGDHGRKNNQKNLKPAIFMGMLPGTNQTKMKIQKSHFYCLPRKT
jgi:hypothetical protein